MLTWDRRWDKTLDASNPPFWTWFVGGRLNASLNCLDRHLEARGSRNALIWVPEHEDAAVQEITYADLHRRPARLARMNLVP